MKRKYKTEFWFLQDADVDIGEAYQDESNQAALLIHHDKDDGSLLMVSCSCNLIFFVMQQIGF